jgi:uncharacterized protein (TIGR03546 family)
VLLSRKNPLSVFEPCSLRKIGKFLRGKATPFQIISATLLGALLGSLPGFGQGPLLLLLLLFLLIILNANLFLAALTGLLVKIIYLILLPVYFSIGVTLLEGPLNGPVAALVNAPVTAWFGLDHYVMVPSLLVGGLIGILLGVLLSRALYAFRHKMANLEAGSEKYQAYTSKFWVKALAWIFLGGLKGKKSWAELGEKRKGLPIRPLGVVFVVSLGVLLYIGYQLLDQTIITSYVRDSLEKANGATVDIAGIEVKPGQNRISVNGLAMADPENLQTNRFASTEIVADVSGMNLLAKKVVIDSLQVLQPKVGTPRKLIGRRTVPAPEPVEDPAEEGEISIDDYLGQAQVWRERLATVKRFYDKIAPHLKKDEEVEDESGPGWRERLAQRAKEAGYANVISESLIRKSPRLLIRELQADNIEIGGNDDQFAFSGGNLSTQPVLVDESGTLRIARQDGNFEINVELPSSANPTRSVLKIRYDNLAVEELEEQVGKDLPMEGGSMDISGEGTIDGGLIDLPLTVTLNNSTLNAFGSSLPMDGFPIEVRIHGTLDNPKLAIPQDAIQEAVKAGGKKQIENLIKEQGGDKLNETLKGLFPGG